MVLSLADVAALVFLLVVVTLPLWPDWLRLLVAHFAKPQIEQAFQAGAEAQRAAYVAGEVIRMECVKRMAYAEGEVAGRAQAWAYMAEVIAERTGGPADYINPEDLARAKKGILH
jgi:hypothetical protein